MTMTNFPNGITSFGIPVVPTGRAFGTTYFVDATNGIDGRAGTDASAPLKTLTQAFTLVSDGDTIMLAPGDYTGNYTTPVNADASFVNVIGTQTGDYGAGTWMGATTASSPIIDVLARGWGFYNIEFDCPTGSSGLRLTKSADGTTNRCDFTTVENCVFTTGKYGIEVAGGGTNVTVRNNKFDQLTETGAFAIIITSSAFQLPAFWVVESNIFATSLNHIGPADATSGWNSSTFKSNVHQSDATTDVTTILDCRGSSASGNMVLDNYFDIAKASFTAATSVRGNATDYAAGNWFLDGAQQEAMNVS